MIDIGDQLTDDEGNVDFQLSSDRDPISVTCGAGTYTFESAQGAGATTFWAWTGSPGDEVDEDTNLQELEDVARPVGRAGPDYAQLSGGLPTNDELAKMGEQVIFTVQLKSQVGARDNSTDGDDISVGPDRTGNVYLLQIERYHLTRVTGTDSDHETKTGNASLGEAALFGNLPGDWNFGVASLAGTGSAVTEAEVAGIRRSAQIGAAYYTPVFPNADGTFTIVLDNPDYHAAVNNPDVGGRFTLRPFHPGNGVLTANRLTDIVEFSNGVSVTADGYSPGTPDNYMADLVVGAVIFSDDSSDPHSVVGTSEEYRIIGGSRTPNTVTVKVVDQYGDPQRNVDISVTSESDNANPNDDNVVYPEQVDITVQRNENGSGDDTRDQGNDGTTVVDPAPASGTGAANATSLTAAAISAAETAAKAAARASGASETATRTVTVAVRVDEADDGTHTVTDVPQDDVIGTFKTRRDGTYRIGYAYTDPDEAHTEMITPQSTMLVRLLVTATATDGDNATSAIEWYELSDDGDPVATTTLADATVTPAEVGNVVRVRWTQIGTSSQSITVANGDPDFVNVYVTDVGRRTIVANEHLTGAADTDEPKAYFYDEDDVFIIENIGASFEMFEEALGLRTNPDDANTCHVNEVMWENYTYWRDPDRFGARPGRVDRTIWEIRLS